MVFAALVSFLFHVALAFVSALRSCVPCDSPVVWSVAFLGLQVGGIKVNQCVTAGLLASSTVSEGALQGQEAGGLFRSCGQQELLPEEASCFFWGSPWMEGDRFRARG